MQEVMDMISRFVLTPQQTSFILGLACTYAFYRQYKKYETELEKEEMIEQLLAP